jgi:hypothetical protein
MDSFLYDVILQAPRPQVGETVGLFKITCFDDETRTQTGRVPIVVPNYSWQSFCMKDVFFVGHNIDIVEN